MLAAAGYGLVGHDNRPAVAPLPAPEPQDAANAPSGTVRLDLGGVTLAFDPPAGDCVYPPDLMRAVVAQQQRLNPDNVIHVAFGDCGQVRAAMEGAARICDFGVLMTPKAQIGQDVDRAQLDRIAANAVDLSSLKTSLDQRLKEAESRLSLQSFYSLGLLERDDRSIYFAFLTKTQGAEGSYTQACVMGMTALKNRLVAYYLYGDYDKNARAELFGLLQKVKSGISDLAQRNG